MEELDQYLGGWGPYQTRVFLLIVLPFVSIGMHTMVAVFIFHVPHHRCRLPEWPEDSYALQNENHRVAVNQTIPMEDSQQSSYSQCSIFSQWNHSSVSNHSQQQRQLQDCQAWVYDTSEVDTSLITQFDLVCDRNKVQAHLNMVFFVGNLLGALGAGYLCDWFGRKPILYISNIICLAVGVASAFPPNVEIFLIYRAIIGATGTAAYIAGFVLVMELVGPEKRTRAGSLLTISWLMGPFLLDALSFLVRQWHYVQLISVAPLVFCLAHWWLLPESPRWLLTKKKTKAAMTVLQKMATVNKTPLSPTSDSMVQFQEEPKGDAGGRQVAMVVLKLMKCPRMVVVTVIILFNWCVISMMYYGLSLNVGNLSGSLRVNFLLSSTVELIGYVVAWVLLERLGRKRSHCCFILTAGLACLATILTVSLGGKELEWVTTALAMVGKLGISASYTVIYIMTAEIFPTAIRNFSEGCGSSWAYIGGAVSPYVADLGQYIGGRLGRVVPLVVFGGLALLAGISALYLPETLHRTLPDTVEDAVSLLKNLNDDKNRKKVNSNEGEDVMDQSSLMSGATTAVQTAPSAAGC